MGVWVGWGTRTGMATGMARIVIAGRDESPIGSSVPGRVRRGDWGADGTAWVKRR